MAEEKRDDAQGQRDLEAQADAPSLAAMVSERTDTLADRQSVFPMKGPKAVMREDGIKSIEGAYRKAELTIPCEVHEAPGIALFGRVIRSLVFSTDLAIIRNCDADAVLAVYPFTCQPAITQALLNVAERPVVAGVAGSITTGMRAVRLATQSEMQGVSGVVVNATTRSITIRNIVRNVDIPVILTVTDDYPVLHAQINAGARILNVAAGKNTPELVACLRERYPEMPIIASGGKSGESIKTTIDAGADAITWTPPTLQELEKVAMARNRRDGAFAPMPFGGFGRGN